MFSTNPYFSLSNILSVVVHSMSRNFFAIKNQIFTSVSKSVVTYINIAVTNISNNIIKHYYGIMKTFKVLVIVKKKQFSKTYFFI